MGRVNKESLAVNFGTALTYNVSSAYDAMGNRTAITYPDSTVINRFYNARGQLNKFNIGGKNPTTFAYLCPCQLAG